MGEKFRIPGDTDKPPYIANLDLLVLKSKTQHYEHLAPFTNDLYENVVINYYRTIQKYADDMPAGDLEDIAMEFSNEFIDEETTLAYQLWEETNFGFEK